MPVSPTSFLTLQKALNMGLVSSLDDFYTSARAILVKSERYFDLFDQIFAHRFQGAEMPSHEGLEMDEVTRALLDEWLKDPKTLAAALDIDEMDLVEMTPEEFVKVTGEKIDALMKEAGHF